MTDIDMSSINTEEDIVTSLYYQGYNRTQINEKTRISTGKISNILEKEKNRLTENSVKAIHKIGKELHDLGYSWADFGGTVSLVNFFKIHSLDLEEVKDALPRMVEKLRENGLHISDLPADIDKQVKQKEMLDSNIQSETRKLAEIQGETAKAVKDAGHTNDSLAKCCELTDFLKNHGLSTDAAEKLENAIRNVEKIGFDGKTFVDKISEKQFIEEQIRVKKEDQARITQELEAARLSIRHLREEKRGLEENVNALKQEKNALADTIREQSQSIKEKQQEIIDAANTAVLRILESSEQAAVRILHIGTEAERVMKEMKQTNGVQVFEPLIRSTLGEKIASIQLRNPVVLALQIFNAQLPERSAYKYKLESLISDMKDDIFL
jgi:chromosome segregation ATPase